MSAPREKPDDGGRIALADRWARPTPLTDAFVVFPADVSHLMPTYEEIPKEFKRWDHPWARWQAGWFHNGLAAWPHPKPGIDSNEAGRHLKAIQGSFQPKHEHKQAAVAYLASLWLQAPEAVGVPTSRREAQ